MQGANRPSARAITLALLNKPYYKASSASNRSYLTAAMGQLIGEPPCVGARATSWHRWTLKHVAATVAVTATRVASVSWEAY